jgi:hypothetical protein
MCKLKEELIYISKNRGRRGRMVVGFKLPMQSVFITTNVVSWDKSIPSFDRMINSVFSYDLSTSYYYFSACHKSYICIEFIINVFRFDGWFMGLSATFNNIQLSYRGGQFYW